MSATPAAVASSVARNPHTGTPQARDLMTHDVVTIAVGTTVTDAADLMIEQGVSNAPVVQIDFTRKILVGFVSEKDVMQCYASGRLHAQPDLRVSDIMRPHAVSVRPETDAYTLAAIFMQHGYRHLPVTSGQLLLGIVSRRDVLVALMDEFRRWKFEDPATRRTPDVASIFTPKFLLG